MAWENLFRIHTHTLAAKVIALHLQAKAGTHAHPQSFNEGDTISPLNTLKIWDVRNVNCTKQMNMAPPKRPHLHTSDTEPPEAQKALHIRERERERKITLLASKRQSALTLIIS